MELTNQEKINVSYLFISAYENIVNLIKPIHNLLTNVVKGVSESPNDLILFMYKKFLERYGKNKILKIKNTHRLLVDVGIFSEQDLLVLIKLSKIRNDIGHESLNIYFDKDIAYEYFCLEELLSLYKRLFNKFQEIIINEKVSDLTENFKFQEINYLSIVKLINSLFSDLKFNGLKDIL